MEVVVRPARPEDGEQVAEVSTLATATLRETYRPTEAALGRSRAGASRTTRLVAVLNGRIVGTTKYEIRKDGIHLIGLGVHPQFRRMEIARKIIEHVKRIAQAKGHTLVSLYTIRETGNVGIFQKLGFEVVREQEAKDALSEKHDNLTDVYMQMSVSNG